MQVFIRRDSATKTPVDCKDDAQLAALIAAHGQDNVLREDGTPATPGAKAKAPKSKKAAAKKKRKR